MAPCYLNPRDRPDNSKITTVMQILQLDNVMEGAFSLHWLYCTISPLIGEREIEELSAEIRDDYFYGDSQTSDQLYHELCRTYKKYVVNKEKSPYSGAEGFKAALWETIMYVYH